MVDVSGMTRAELESHLARLKADLEDAEAERMFVLGQTGLHVSAGAVRRYETELADLKAKIAEAEQALTGLG
jgi:hypothetical protein